MSGKVNKYLMTPSNGPKNLPYNAVGFFNQPLPCPTNVNKTIDCRVRILLLIKKGIIKDARAEVFGEPAVIASANYVISIIKGLSFPIDIEQFSSESIAEALEINKYSVLFHRCVAVHEALKEAVTSYIDSPSD